GRLDGRGPALLRPVPAGALPGGAAPAVFGAGIRSPRRRLSIAPQRVPDKSWELARKPTSVESNGQAVPLIASIDPANRIYGWCWRASALPICLWLSSP